MSALEATRQIFSADGGEPIHHLEAMACSKLGCLTQGGSTRAQKHEPRPSEDGAILDIARRIAMHANPEAAAKAIVQAFLSDPPRNDHTPDEPTISGSMTPTEALKRQRTNFAKPDSEVGPIKPAPSDGGKRSVDEVVRACKVLGLAVRMNAGLVSLVRGAADRVRKLARRMGSDASARTTLNGAADNLDLAVAAPGTMEARSPREKREDAEDQAAFAAAFSAGDDAEAALQFSKEWRELKERGHTRLSRERYIQLSMRRHKKQ